MSNCAPTQLTSTPDSLVVYQQQARVRRVAEISADLLQNRNSNGEVQVLIPLPESFDRDSIQVEFNQFLAQRATLGGVTVEKLPEGEEDERLEGISEKRRNELQERVKELNKQISYADQDIRESDNTVKFVESVVNNGLDVKNPVWNGSQEMWNPETWKTQLEALEATRRKQGETRYTLECRRKELREELQMVQRELNQVGGPRHHKPRPEGVRIVLAVEGSAPQSNEGGELKLYVSYMIWDAFWNASYEVHLNTTKNTVQVGYNARVTIHRGDDFSNVQLTLCSTAPRHLGTEPELDPWRCGLQAAAPPAPPVAPVPNRKLMGYGGGFSAAMPQSSGMRVSQAATEDVTSGVANFVIPNPVSIKADGEARRFPLVQLNFPAEIEYISVPALDSAVYTRVKTTNESDYLLLPGSASLFLDGDFLCTSNLPRAAPGGKLMVDFGVDRAIELKRVLLTELTAAQKNRLSWDSDKMVRTFVYRSTIKNRKTRESVTVTIKEKAPKSNDETLKVKLVEPESLPTEEEKAAFDSVGRVELKVTIPPSGSKEVLFGFVVECPSGKTIYGIDDRH